MGKLRKNSNKTFPPQKLCIYSKYRVEQTISLIRKKMTLPLSWEKEDFLINLNTKK